MEPAPIRSGPLIEFKTAAKPAPALQTEVHLERLTGAQLAAFGSSQTDQIGTPPQTPAVCASRRAAAPAAGCDASTQLRDVELPSFDDEVLSTGTEQTILAAQLHTFLDAS